MNTENLGETRRTLGIIISSVTLNKPLINLSELVSSLIIGLLPHRVVKRSKEVYSKDFLIYNSLYRYLVEHSLKGRERKEKCHRGRQEGRAERKKGRKLR